jgi:NADH-quinone oxidoreductase subunit L
MTLPLVVLAVMAVVAGFFQQDDWLGKIIEGWVPHETEELMTHADFKMWIALVSSGLGLAGLAGAWLVYQVKIFDTERFRAVIQPIPEILENRYYLDALYQDFFVKTVLLGGTAGALALWDKYVIDGVVNGVARGANWISGQVKVAQAGQVQLYATVMFFGSIAAVVGILLVSEA